MKGATTIELDVAAVDGHEVGTGVGKLLSVRLECRENKPGSSHLYQDSPARLVVLDIKPS